MSEEPKTLKRLQAELEQARAELEQSRDEVAELKVNAETQQSSAFQERQLAHAERARLIGLANLSSSEAGHARKEAEADRAQLRGEVAEFKGVVTEQLQQLTQQKLRSERFVETAPVGIAYLDKRLYYRWANPAFTSLMNRPLDEVINHPLLEVFPQAKERLFGLLTEVIKTGKAETASKPVMITFVPAGEESAKATNWDLLALPMVDEHHRVEGVLVAIEVTERVKKERLQQAAIEDASRQMRPPLASISGSARSLEAGLLGEDQRRSIAKIQEAEGQLTRIVDDMLELARIEAGRYELHYEEADVSALIRENLGRLARAAEKANVHPVVTLSDEPLIVKADRRRLERVLQTLLGNALASTRPGGRMAVTVTAGDHEARVEIADSGEGIDAQELGHLFEQFSQLNLSKPDEFARAGKGLAISKTLIELHGGTLWATSEKGRGSTFWFRLPLARQDVQAGSSPGLTGSMRETPEANTPSEDVPGKDGTAHET